MKTKFFHLVGEAKDQYGDRHIVTVVGKYKQEYIQKEHTQKVPVYTDDNGNITIGDLSWKKKTLKRTLIVGYSICHPNDKFDEDKGIAYAKKRINNDEGLGTLTTSNATMLTKDLIEAILLCKLNYITHNLDKFTYTPHNLGKYVKGNDD